MSNLEMSLEQRLAALEGKLDRLAARADIENLMAKHNQYVSAGQGRRIVPELWTKSDEASLEYGASGVYKNLWKVNTFYVNEAVPGRMTTVTAANPYIEVAADGNSARGIWMAFGTETDAGDLGLHAPGEGDQRRQLLSSADAGGRKYRAEWLLQKHEVRFVREEGAWKICTLHVSEFFRCPAGSDWVRYAAKRMETDGMWLESLFETPDPLPFFENLPSEPTTYHWQYTTEALPELQFELK